jgi:hypothetical protein
MAKKSGIGDRVRALNTRSSRPGGLEAEQRRALIRELEPDVRVLEDLLDRDLSAWRS